MEEDYCILAIKPEYLITKIGIYSPHNIFYLKSIIHSEEELLKFKKNTDQCPFRTQVIIDVLKKASINFSNIKYIVARGGLLKPIESGIYEVNDAMKKDLIDSPVGVHSVNLSGLIANALLPSFPNAKAYIADPAVVDEMNEIARVTGFPGIERKSVFHALNHKYVARRYAQSVGKSYEDLNLIVAHIGDGISIGAHKKGKVIDVNQCFDGEGPFSLERAGTLPMIELARLCFSGKYSLSEIELKLRNKGGIFAYTNSYDSSILDKTRTTENEPVFKLFEAMAYQVSKYIGYMLPVFHSEIDAIILTGHLSNNKWFVNQIIERVKFFAPISNYPGEDVLDALAQNAILLIRGELQPKIYV